MQRSIWRKTSHASHIATIQAHELSVKELDMIHGGVGVPTATPTPTPPIHPAPHPTPTPVGGTSGHAGSVHHHHHHH